MRKRNRSSSSRVPSSSRMIAVYGHFDTEVNQLEPQWKTRVDGVKQRYWVRTGNKEFKTFSDRFEFYGTGRDLQMAVAMTFDNLVPKKKFQKIAARDFVNNPYQYARVGYWKWKEVES